VTNGVTNIAELVRIFGLSALPETR
jgi:hypothetical protein